LISQGRELDITSFQDTTSQAFLEKLFQAAVFHAVIKNDQAAKHILKWLLGSHYDVNSPVQFQQPTIPMTAVQLSTMWGRIDVLETLIEHGADVNLTLSNVSRPLELAAQRTQDIKLSPLPPLSLAKAASIAHILLKNYAKVGFRSRDGHIFFVNLAAVLKDDQFLRDVLAKYYTDASLRVTCTNGILCEVTPVTAAAGFTDRHVSQDEKNKIALNLVDRILNALGSFPQFGNIETWITADAFIAAAAAGNHGVISFLYNRYESVGSPNSFGITPLHAAAEQYDGLETCRLLLELGHPVNPPSSYPSPLHIACDFDRDDIVLFWSRITLTLMRRRSSSRKAFTVNSPTSPRTQNGARCLVPNH